MKVAELKKGMLVECQDKDLRFVVTDYSESGPWLRVARFKRGKSWASGLRAKWPKFVMYLGTKKDVHVKVAWSNQFVLADNQIVAVDPAAWRWMKEMDESR